MEMPIQVIVVMFVALIVGGAIIAFSQGTLNKAKLDLNDQWKNDPAHKDQVVEVDTLTPTTVLNLAQECVKQNTGSVEEKLCFAVFYNNANGNILALNNQDLGGGFNITVQPSDPNTKALRITYNPLANHVEVT